MAKRVTKLQVTLCLFIVLMLALCLLNLNPSHTRALNLSDYFEIKYQPVQFSKTDIQTGEVFYARIRGEAICIQDLPVPVSRATIISRVLTQSKTTDIAEVILNPSYSIDINAFPNKIGGSYDIDERIELQFPQDSLSGDYTLVAELIKAEVYILGGWNDVTRYLPSTQPMGSVTYRATTQPAPAPSPTSSPTPSPTLSPTPGLTPSPTPSLASSLMPGLTSSPTLSPVPSPIPDSTTESNFHWWWVTLGLILAGAAAAVAYLLWWRRRGV